MEWPAWATALTVSAPVIPGRALTAARTRPKLESIAGRFGAVPLPAFGFGPAFTSGGVIRVLAERVMAATASRQPWLYASRFIGSMASRRRATFSSSTGVLGRAITTVIDQRE